MELTTTQIQQIQKFLKEKGVSYDDIKIELLDHICSEIEGLMVQDISFESAFETVTKNWSPKLTFTSSFYLGSTYSRPKFIIDRMKSEIKHHTIKINLFMVSMLLLSIFWKLDFSSNYVTLINYISQAWVISCAIAILIAFVFILRTSEKTSFRFLFKTQILPYTALPFLVSDIALTKNGTIDVFLLIMVTVLPFLLFSKAKRLYNAHFYIVKQLAV